MYPSRWVNGGAAAVVCLIASLVLLALPDAAVAHGDDTVRLQSFFGPVLALAVFGVVVRLGRSLLRRTR